MHKILMVEDDAAIRGALGRHLSRWGYQVQAAENFQNILEQFEEFQPTRCCWISPCPFLTDTTGAARSGVPAKRRLYFYLRPETI